jgi:hypothetical protein
MASAPIEVVREQDAQIRESNRAMGVVEYDAKGQRVSSQIHEVVNGRHHLPDGQTLYPGMRFRPLERQVQARGPKRRTSLNGKSRELTPTELGGLTHMQRPLEDQRFAGADIGLRALPMAEGTLRRALEAKLDESDFEGVEPAYEGQYTRSQVEQIIAAKSGPSDNEGEPEADEAS